MLRLLLVALLLSGCAAPYDYAENVDFGRFDTVALAPAGDFSSLDGSRIGEAAQTLLPSRGLALTTPEQASLWLNYQLVEETRLLTTMPRMFSRHDSFWHDEERVYGAVRELKLKLWLEQPGTGQVVWNSKHPRAFPADRFRGAERSGRVYTQVAELLENYPPRH